MAVDDERQREEQSKVKHKNSKETEGQKNKA